MDWTENLFVDRRPIHASSWIDRWSAVKPVLKADLIETGHGRGRIAIDKDAIWVINKTSETLTRIERRTALADWRADLDHQPEAVAVGAEAAWVLAENGWLWRFHSDGTSEGVARTGHGARDLVCDAESAWVLQGDGDLIAFDQWTGEVTVEAKIPRGARRLLVADGVLFALTGGGDRVCRIARENGIIEARGTLPANGNCAAVHGGVLWVACSRPFAAQWGALVGVDLATMAPTTVHQLPNAPRAIAAGAGHLWVACGRRGDRASSVIRVEPASGEMIRWATTEFTIHDLAIVAKQIIAACGLKLSIDVAAPDGGG